MTQAPVTEAELQAHVDGRLPPERAAVVETWLTAHPDEGKRVAAYREQTEALRTVFAPIAIEALPAALDLRLPARRKRGWSGLRSSMAAASAAGLLLIGGAGGWTLRALSAPRTVGTAALAREAAASYAVFGSDLARPVELAADQRHTLDGWFSERLARPIAAPDLGAAGLRLIGGRLVSSEHGPAGLYLYRDAGGGRVALYIRPMEVDGTDRMTRREQGRVTGWTWADDGLGFGVFGVGSDRFLHAAANEVRARFNRV